MVGAQCGRCCAVVGMGTVGLASAAGGVDASGAEQMQRHRARVQLCVPRSRHRTWQAISDAPLNLVKGADFDTT